MDKEIARQNKVKRGYDYEVSTIKSIEINKLLSLINENIDFLAIDVEGLDISLLLKLDLGKFKPKVILFESHSNNDKDNQLHRKLEIIMVFYLDRRPVSPIIF